MTGSWKSLTATPKIKVGDLVVKTSELGGAKLGDVGLVLEVDINMWGEEMVPTGVGILWGNEIEMEVEYEDEVELV